MVQFDNEFPQPLSTKPLFIPKGVWHRLIKGNTDLKVSIKEHMTKKVDFIKYIEPEFNSLIENRNTIKEQIQTSKEPIEEAGLAGILFSVILSAPKIVEILGVLVKKVSQLFGKQTKGEQTGDKVIELSQKIDKHYHNVFKKIIQSSGVSQKVGIKTEEDLDKAAHALMLVVVGTAAISSGFTTAQSFQAFLRGQGVSKALYSALKGTLTGIKGQEITHGVKKLAGKVHENNENIQELRIEDSEVLRAKRYVEFLTDLHSKAESMYDEVMNASKQYPASGRKSLSDDDRDFLSDLEVRLHELVDLLEVEMSTNTNIVQRNYKNVKEASEEEVENQKELNKELEKTVDIKKELMKESQEKIIVINPHAIGKAKYSIDVYDGDTHKDGSPFWGIRIFKNKEDLKKAVKDFKSKGYTLMDKKPERLLKESEDDFETGLGMILTDYMTTIIDLDGLKKRVLELADLTGDKILGGNVKRVNGIYTLTIKKGDGEVVEVSK